MSIFEYWIDDFILGTRHHPWHYWAYGLHIASDVEVASFLSHRPVNPDDPTAIEAADLQITIDRGSTPDSHLPSEVLKEAIAVRLKANQTLELYVQKIGLFQIREGKRVHSIPEKNISPTQLSLALSGVVMAAVLYQRQNFVVHASAIALRGRAILFLGDSGAGKSSLALAFHQQGFPVLTDDLASIHPQDKTLHLAPALPQIRTTEETARQLNLDWSQLKELPGLPKKYLGFEENFPTHSIPLQQIYILKNSKQNIAFQELSGHQKIMELMHHSEVMHLFSQNQSLHFLTCANIANQVPLHYLYRPKDWGQIDAVMANIEEHLSAN